MLHLGIEIKRINVQFSGTRFSSTYSSLGYLYSNCLGIFWRLSVYHLNLGHLSVPGGTYIQALAPIYFDIYSVRPHRRKWEAQIK